MLNCHLNKLLRNRPNNIKLPFSHKILTFTRNYSKIPDYGNKYIKPNLPQTDDEFAHYLAGLIDGDGSFGTGIGLTFNILDQPLANYIKKRLGFGFGHQKKSYREGGSSIENRSSSRHRKSS